MIKEVNSRCFPRLFLKAEWTACWRGSDSIRLQPFRAMVQSIQVKFSFAAKPFEFDVHLRATGSDLAQYPLPSSAVMDTPLILLSSQAAVEGNPTKGWRKVDEQMKECKPDLDLRTSHKWETFKELPRSLDTRSQDSPSYPSIQTSRLVGLKTLQPIR